MEGLKLIAATTLLGFCTVSTIQETNGLSLVPPPSPICGPTCEIGCECGRVLDERGCPTCQCKACDLSLVPPPGLCGPTCAIACECGRVSDDRGCPTCQCKPCVGCRRKCSYGYINFLGTSTCWCKPAPICPKLACLKYIKCQFGMKIVNGCRTCSCNPPTCPLRKCRYCPSGYVIDRNGCRTCQCKVPTTTAPVCPELDCLKYIKCAFGVKVVDGCKTCSCNTPVCPLMKCQFCPAGYVTDSVTGCRTCECKEPITIGPIIKPKCGTKSICPLYVHCPFGYEVDEDGCRTCTCAGAPTS